MAGLDSGRAALKAVRGALRLEVESDPGRVNLAGVALGFLAIVLCGAADAIEPIAQIWAPGYEAGFPWLPIIAIFFAGFLVCVAILATIDVLVATHAPRRGRGKKGKKPKKG